MAVSAAKAMWSMIQEVLFGPKPEPPLQLRKPDPPIVPPTILSHTICGYGPARDMLVDEMISWLADVGPEYTARTLNNFISVQIGEANLMYVTKNGQVVGFAVFRIAYKKVYLDRCAPVHELLI